MEGVSCALGPLLGSVVYNWFGYIGTFYFFTGFICLFGFGAMCFVPKSANRAAQEDAPDEEADTESISYWRILKCRRSFAALMACVLGMVCCAFIDPTLTLRLHSRHMN